MGPRTPSPPDLASDQGSQLGLDSLTIYTIVGCKPVGESLPLPKLTGSQTRNLNQWGLAPKV